MLVSGCDFWVRRAGFAVEVYGNDFLDYIFESEVRGGGCVGEQAEFAGTHRFIGESQIRLDTMEDTLTNLADKRSGYIW